MLMCPKHKLQIWFITCVGFCDISLIIVISQLNAIFLSINYLLLILVKFCQVVFGEDERGYAHHVMGIVHDAAAYLPDLLDHMSENYPSLTVKNGVLGRNSDIETTTMAQYRDQVCILLTIHHTWFFKFLIWDIRFIFSFISFQITLPL